MKTPRESLLPTILGWALLLIGAGFAFIAPLELYVFYMLGEHGSQHIEGFGFGSFMFANVAIQIAGYYTLAALGLVLGYGHLKRKEWVTPAMIALLVTWLIVGLPLVMVAVGIFIQSKDPSPSAFWLLLPMAVLIYPALPVILLLLYRRGGILDFTSAPLSMPLPRRVLIALLVLAVLALHGMFLFRGLFPSFGVLLYDLPGFIALSLTFLALLFLISSLVTNKPWGWWGAMGLALFLLLSTILTLPHYTLDDILNLMYFSPVEEEAFSNLPFLGIHLTIPAAVPMLTLLAVLAWDKRTKPNDKT